MGTEAKQTAELEKLEAEFRDAPPSVRVAHDLAPYPPGRDPEANGDGGAIPTSDATPEGGGGGADPEPQDAEPDEPEPEGEDRMLELGLGGGDGPGIFDAPGDVPGTVDPWADPDVVVPAVRLEKLDVLKGGELRFEKAGMRLRTWRRGIAQSDLPFETRAVLRYLAEHMDPDGSNCFPSTATIARAVGRSWKAADRYLKPAEEGDWIRRVRRRRKNKSRGTTLYVPGIPEGFEWEEDE